MLKHPLQSVPQVGGPFEIALQWSGFDLNQSSDKGKRVLLIITTSICVLLCTLFLAVVALTLFRDAKVCYSPNQSIFHISAVDYNVG